MFFRRYTDFKTRSTRAEYWWVALALFVYYVIAAIVIFTFGGFDPETAELGPLGTVLLAVFGLPILGIIIPMIALVVRRFHDAGLSGWWYLGLVIAGLIPVIGLLASIATLVITVLPSKPANQWGPNPHDGGVAEVFG